MDKVWLVRFCLFKFDFLSLDYESQRVFLSSDAIDDR